MLAFAMQRIEGADKMGADRESTRARDAGRKATGLTAVATQRKGLSPEAVAHIRAAVEGHWVLFGVQL